MSHAGGLAALVEDLHDDCGRRQHETHRRDEGDDRRKPHGNAGSGQQGAAGRDLHRAEAEDLLAHAPQPGRLHLQANDEQEHDDAEFGDVQDGLRVRKEAEPERPDDQPGGEIAEHRAQAQAPEQRHRDDTRRQQHHHTHQVVSVSFGCHVPSGSSGDATSELRACASLRRSGRASLRCRLSANAIRL